jgi:hypothetical protein
MANPKTVAALLAQQEEDVLTEMLRSTVAEIQRLTLEQAQLEEALGRKRSRRGARSPGEAGRQQSGVKRQDVYKVVFEKSEPTTPAEVRHQLLVQGYEISGAAVRNHLRRLVTDKRLATNGDGLYFLPDLGITRNGSGDPLFTDSQNQSESPV